MADLALVCGGRGALGSAVVEALLARGDEVVVADRDVVDLTNAAAVEAFWDGLESTPRFLVNAVGAYRGGTATESDDTDLAFLLDVNLATTWWSCRAAARRMDPGGAIMNIAASSGRAGGKGSAAYAVSKAAVIRLTEVLALELEGRVRVNALLPTTIATPANAAQGISGGTAPDEIATVVSFLCSDAASSITGALVPV